MIKGLKTVPQLEKKTDLIIDLKDFTGDETSQLRFHEPMASDLFPNSEATKELKRYFPEFVDQMLYQVYILGRCYIPHPDDKDEVQKPAIDFGNLAKSNKEVFFYIIGEFLNHFTIADLDEKVLEAKNESPE